MSETDELASGKPGKTRDPLDNNDDVMRLGLVKQSSYEAIGANCFSLNSAERDQEWKRISVWETSLTSVEQARSLLTNPERRLVINLNVGDIRAISLEEQVKLDVKWDRLSSCIDENGNKALSYSDGCKGHCALDGIYPKGKGLRKKLRKRLADLATSSNWYVIDD